MPAPEKTAGDAAEVKFATVAELTAAYPALVGQIQTEAATGERNRILGIEKNAGKRKGIDDLVGGMKGDPTVTPAMAAERILQHENSKLEAAHANLKGVEDVAGKIPAAPSAGGEGGGKQYAQTPDGWKQEYADSEKLQAEFGSPEAYVALKQGEASGRVRILQTKGAA